MPITRCNAAGFRILLGLALMVATIAMLSPKPPDPVMFDWEDKLWHMLTFAVLAFLADAGWPDNGFVAVKYLPLFAYGVVIELLQQGIPNRFFDLYDILANTAGLVVYSLLILGLLRRLQIR